MSAVAAVSKQVSKRPAAITVIANPMGGRANARALALAIERHFGTDLWACEVRHYDKSEELADMARRAVADGAEMCIAAGGDGTVSGVANGLVGTEVPLGILALGTANSLARELGLPTALDDACALLAGEHGIKRIDVMRVAGRYALLTVSAGFSALTMGQTPKHHKRRFGIIAYLWTGARLLAGLQTHHFSVSIDGVPRLRARATDVVVTNGGAPGEEFVRPGLDCHLDDGELGVYVMRTRRVLDFIWLARRVVLGDTRPDPRVRSFAARDAVTIASRHPLTAQADGDVIGETPVEVRLMPRALKVIVPLGQTLSGARSCPPAADSRG